MSSIFIIPLLVLVIKHVKRSKLNLPPSLTKFPIIGNRHQLGTVPHRSLQALSRKYGPLMLLHMGSIPTLVVSSAEMAREMMRTHDIAFSNCPMITAAKIFVYGCKDVAFAPFGEYWRHARKICVQELLSLKRVQSFQKVEEENGRSMFGKIGRSKASFRALDAYFDQEMFVE
ncbi:hypothetical protein ACOSQ2_025501 [Xanthoceras sorbifolium]